MRTGSVSVPGAAMNTVMVTSSNELMKASAQPLIRPGSTSGRVMRRSTVPSEAPSEIAACSIERSSPTAEASVRRSAKGSTITICASTRPDEGAAQTELGEEAQEGDAQHDVRDHQRRHEERRHGLAAAEAIARDGQRRRHREGDGDGRAQRAQPQAAPEGRDELGIAADGVEPAQRPAVGREREIALGREGDEADDQDRRQHEDDEQRVEDERDRPIPAHDVRLIRTPARSGVRPGGWRRPRSPPGRPAAARPPPRPTASSAC